MVIFKRQCYTTQIVGNRMLEVGLSTPQNVRTTENDLVFERRNEITTLLCIKRACELNKSHIISTDEDPGLRIESFAIINLRGVSTNKTIILTVCMLE